MKGFQFPRTSCGDPVGLFTIVVHARFRCDPRAKECRSQFQMDELRRQLAIRTATFGPAADFRLKPANDSREGGTDSREKIENQMEGLDLCTQTVPKTLQIVPNKPNRSE